MKLFNLGDMNWKQTQLIYHALAYNNIESLVLHSPRDSYMCVGLHQDPRDELDFDYCNKNNIGIFRREIGGGTVLLDNNQLFYNLIIHRKHPKVPYTPESFFRRFGGSILLDFDYERMAKAVLLPSNLQGKFLELMRNNLTTVKRELGVIPPKEEFCSILASKFADLLGPMTNGMVDAEINIKMRELDEQYSSDTWLFQRGTKQIGREIKVREGVYLFHKTFNTQKGSVEVTFEIEEDKVKKVSFSNAFPLSRINQEKLEERLIGLEYDKDKLVDEIIMIIKTHGGFVVA